MPATPIESNLTPWCDLGATIRADRVRRMELTPRAFRTPPTCPARDQAFGGSRLLPVDFDGLFEPSGELRVSSLYIGYIRL